VTCEEGAILLEQAWSAAYKEAAFAYGPRLYPSAPNPAKLFMENLPLAHGYLTRLSHSAEEILQQYIMIKQFQRACLKAFPAPSVLCVIGNNFSEMAYVFAVAQKVRIEKRG
jgi:hypothetical protein